MFRRFYHPGASFALLASALAADPVVSNLSAAQRPGTKLVDIRYDVAADTPTVKVTLEISGDAGTTYNVPVTSAAGAVGNEVAVGTGKTITWNAGVDWNGKFTPQTRFRVVADDVAPAMIAVAAGALPATSWAGAQRVDAFYMSKTEITWAEFEPVRTWATANGYDIGSAGAALRPKHPVTTLSLFQALKWCNAASERAGLRPVYKVAANVYRTGLSEPQIDATANGYRLPREKEWEFAALGGVKTNGYVYSGSNDVNAVAWYNLNSDGGMHDVATKQPNELGLSDMSGNVSEFCFDAWGTIRGGNFGYDANYCVVAYRFYFDRLGDGFSGQIGFRVARSSVP